MSEAVSRPLRPQSAGDCRCDCGKLVARLEAGRLEIKCRGCKRTLRIRLDDLRSGDFAPLR